MRKKYNSFSDKVQEKTKKDTSHVRWERLDNTAHLFPAISGENMTNVYRISVTLKDLIKEELLQQALDTVLVKFNGFNLRLRRGVFWYYFEENTKRPPKVTEEGNIPRLKPFGIICCLSFSRMRVFRPHLLNELFRNM